MAGYEGGFTGAIGTLSDVQQAAVLNAMRRMQMAQDMERLKALPIAGQTLYNRFGQGALPVPPPAGTLQGGPQPTPPGTSSVPAAPPVAPGMAGPPPAGAAGPAGLPPIAPPQAAGQLPRPMPPQIPPFRPMPTAPLGAPQQGGGGGLPPPPSGLTSQAAPPDETMGRARIDIGGLIQDMQRRGVPPAQAMIALQELQPVMTAQNQQELSFYRAHNQALTAANQVYRNTIMDYTAHERERHNREEEDRKRGQGQQRIDNTKRALDARLSRSVGAGVKLDNKEFIYPKDASGRPDETQPPIGVRGMTKTGRIVYVSADGGAETGAAMAPGGTAREGKDTKVGVTNVVRQNIVKAGVTNSLARLDEIEKTYPNTNTSAFFGTHGDNPATRALYGAGRSTMSSEQKQADAAWASMIDEAIPVFTGGLRGSDAFRRFLIEQAPGPGDDAASRKEKVRLLRANINGTSKAFFNKFQSDPSMWGQGVTKEEVTAATGGGGGSAPSGAPQVGEKRTINGVPAHWDGKGWLPDAP